MERGSVPTLYLLKRIEALENAHQALSQEERVLLESLSRQYPESDAQKMLDAFGESLVVLVAFLKHDRCEKHHAGVRKLIMESSNNSLLQKSRGDIERIAVLRADCARLEKELAKVRSEAEQAAMLRAENKRLSTQLDEARDECGRGKRARHEIDYYERNLQYGREFSNALMQLADDTRLSEHALRSHVRNEVMRARVIFKKYTSK